jgi:hypothetical protein
MIDPTPPASDARTKDSRDTAEGCRDRASADLAQAGTMNTVNGRQVLEKSAASWTTRAELLERIETGIEARRTAAVPTAVKLTSAEIAEDAAELRYSPPAA